MEIIFPPLVEQGVKYSFEIAKQSVNKSDLYRFMVEQKMITETGLPTPEAIKKGIIKDYYEDEGLSFEDFLEIYPIFADYDEELFQSIDGYWEIPVDMKADLISVMESDTLSFADFQQIETYLEDR